MVKHMEEDHDVFFVSTLLSRANILDNHVSDSFQTMLLMHKVGGKCGSSDLREMLMFRDDELLLSYTVRPQRATQSSRVIMNASTR